MSIKTLTRHHLTPVQMTVATKQREKCRRGRGVKGALVHSWCTLLGTRIGVAAMENGTDVSQKS